MVEVLQMEDNSSFDIRIHHQHSKDQSHLNGIVLQDDVMFDIYNHALMGKREEVAGALFGTIVNGQIQVKACCAARSGSSDAVSVTITHNDWDLFHKKLQQYPEYQIVGWYHSHPGHGIFLSQHDIFIHKAFFSSEDQIALVVDHHKNEIGIFAWESNSLCLATNVEIEGRQKTYWQNQLKRPSVKRDSHSFAKFLEQSAKLGDYSKKVGINSIQLNISLDPYYMKDENIQQRDALLVNWIQHNKINTKSSKIQLRVCEAGSDLPKLMLTYDKGKLIYIEAHDEKRGFSIDEKA